jgi:NADPH:quinone reductase
VQQVCVDVDDARAASLVGNYYTMYFALARRGALRPGETVLVLGSAGGIPTVKVNRLLLRNVAVIGVGWGEFVNRSPGAQSLFGSGVARLVEAGLRPPPPVRLPLSKGAEALESLANGGVKGKLVLQP